MIVAWQGWTIRLPGRWSPVRLEGDWDKGYALFADLHRPRLGIRWQKARGRKFQAGRWAREMLREEVGQLAADEAAPLDLGEDWDGSMLYIEPKPPGRDVWVGFSRRSGRALELVYHSRRREKLMQSAILPTVIDQADLADRQAQRDKPKRGRAGSQEALRPDKVIPAHGWLDWAIFELSCRVPAEMPLERHQLNAGDLSLTFSGQQKGAKVVVGSRNATDGAEKESQDQWHPSVWSLLTIRQVAVAELALKRMTKEQWLFQLQRGWKKLYRPETEIRQLEVTAEDGRKLTGISRVLNRRRRFFLSRRIARQLIGWVLHDPVNDRLILGESDHESLLRQVIQTVGWARAYEE